MAATGLQEPHPAQALPPGGRRPAPCDWHPRLTRALVCASVRREPLAPLFRLGPGDTQTC